MKKTLSLIAIIAMSSAAYAGGEIVPVQEIEAEQIIVPVECPTTVVEKIVTVEKIVNVPAAPIKNLYVGIAGIAAQYEPECNCPGQPEKDTSAGAMLRVGSHVAKYLDVEVRAAKTFIKDDGGAIESHVGVYLKPKYDITDKWTVYALAGVANTETTDGEGMQHSDINSAAYGAGVEYRLNDSWNLFTDYENMVNKSGDMPTIAAVAFGVDYRF